MAVAMPTLHRENIAALWAYVSELFHRTLIVSQYAGCLILWYGSITAALAGKVPAGVTCWLTTGIFFLVYQEGQLRKAAKNALTDVEYWRRIAMLTPVRMHFAFNTFTLFALWVPIFMGTRELPMQDIVGLFFCVISVLLVLFVAAWKDVKYTASVVIFLLALCTRIVEQGAVAFSDAVEDLPYPVVYGLLLVALQIAATTFLELLKAHRARQEDNERSIEAYQAIRWTFLSTLCNFASALLVWGFWQRSR